MHTDVMMPRRLACFTSFILGLAAFSAAFAESLQTEMVRISSECKDSFYGPALINPGPRPDYAKWDPDRAKPFTFQDTRTQITFYVESDGRHIAAVGLGGTLLWVRNPFEDEGLCPYRSARPVISHLEITNVRSDYLQYLMPGAARRYRARGFDSGHTFLSLQFDSSQFGLLDETTGTFFSGGQN
jgi:hypothetical protein